MKINTRDDIINRFSVIFENTKLSKKNRLFKLDKRKRIFEKIKLKKNKSIFKISPAIKIGRVLKTEYI
jgi:hypothetical protein